MTDPLIAYDDLELFLVGWYRAALASRSEAYAQGVTVVRVEPKSDDFPTPMLVIRHDGTTDTSFITGEASVGVTVLAGSKRNPKPATDLLRLVHALASQIPSPDPSNPVSALLGRTGPFLVPEDHDRARAYATLTLAVAGRGI